MTSLDTLGSQSFTSIRPKDTGLWLQRILFVVFWMLVASTVIFWNSKSIFLLLRQPPEVVYLSSQYLKIWSLGSPAFVLYLLISLPTDCRFESLKRYMQCQGKMQVPTYVLLFCAPMNAVLNYCLVWHTSLEFIGAPTATVITHWTMAISLMIYAGIYGSPEAWPGWTRHIFEDWKSWKYMLYLAFSGVIMICSEVWSWEVVIFASSFLGVKSLAANSILQVPASVLSGVCVDSRVLLI